MKAFLQLIAAGLIGGAIAFGAFKAFDRDTIIYEQMPSDTTAKQVSLSDDDDFSNYDFSRDFVRAAEIANPAVVHITAKNKAAVAAENNRRTRSYDPWADLWGYRRGQERPRAGTGSGVLIDGEGTIVTNNHVVGFADILEVTTHDGEVYSAEKIGTDPSTDLAVIKITDDDVVTPLPHLKFGDSDDVKVGQWVVAAGNPFNLKSTVTAGIVSAIGRDIDIIRDRKAIEEFIQTDAVVNPGNSGGALVNIKGELIGINTAISSPTGVYAGYSFAIPGNLVQRVAKEILEYGGDIRRAMLGIYMASIEDVKNEGIDVGIDRGVYVANYLVDQYGRKIGFSSAEYAGIEIGDVIIGVNDMPVNNQEDLSESLKFAKIGDTLNVLVMRDGKLKKIPVKLRQGI